MIAGLIFTAHGWQKLVGYDEWHGAVASMGLPMPDVLAPLAVAGEFAGGLGLILGLLTRIAALGAMTVMVVAIATVHWTHGLFAKDNGFEFPLLLATTAFFFLLRGAGAVSLDALWQRPRSRVVVAREEDREPHHDHGHYAPGRLW